MSPWPVRYTFSQPGMTNVVRPDFRTTPHLRRPEHSLAERLEARELHRFMLPRRVSPAPFPPAVGPGRDRKRILKLQSICTCFALLESPIQKTSKPVAAIESMAITEVEEIV